MKSNQSSILDPQQFMGGQSELLELLRLDACSVDNGQPRAFAEECDGRLLDWSIAKSQVR
jgi:hypothetical protein